MNFTEIYNYHKMNNPYQDILNTSISIQNLTKYIGIDDNQQIADIVLELQEFTISIQEIIDLFETVHNEDEIQRDKIKVSQWVCKILKTIQMKPIIKQTDYELITTYKAIKNLNKRLAKLYIEVLHKTEMPKMKL